MGAVARDAGRVFLGDKLQFLVKINIGANVAARVHGIEHFAGDLELTGAGDEGFDAGLGLGRIGGVGNDDPVAMPIKGKRRIELAFPVQFRESRSSGHFESSFPIYRNSSSAHTATLPHFPEAMSA